MGGREGFNLFSWKLNKFVIGYLLLVIGYQETATGHWSLATGLWSAKGYRTMGTGARYVRNGNKLNKAEDDDE
jgi:hypothetical protein